MTGCRINKFGIFTISWLRSVCMNVKIRNKFIEIKYSVSNGLVIFITNYRWFRILKISRYRRSNGSKPIPKSSSADPRDPLSYRGIALASAIYKIYCSVINERLFNWAESNNLIADEQNGFRKKRSTVDHISSLTSITDTRKKARKSTFCAFIDFKKAYDTINRSKLWCRLDSIGLCGKLFRAVKSL